MMVGLHRIDIDGHYRMTFVNHPAASMCNSILFSLT